MNTIVTFSTLERLEMAKHILVHNEYSVERVGSICLKTNAPVHTLKNLLKLLDAKFQDDNNDSDNNSSIGSDSDNDNDSDAGEETLVTAMNRFTNIHVKADVILGIKLVSQQLNLSREYVYSLPLSQIRDDLNHIITWHDLDDFDYRNASVAVFWIEKMV